MKKVIYVSYGHVDVSISLLKHFRENIKNIEIDLILVFTQNKKKESILDFEHLDVQNGFQDDEITCQILGKELDSYFENTKINLFVYQNLKAKSFKNIQLSFKLFKVLRKYDIVHISGQDGTLFHILPLLKRKKIIYTVHDLIPHTGEGKNKINYLSKFIFNNSNTIIFQNKGDKLKFEKLFGSTFKTGLIPIGPLDVYKIYSSGFKSEQKIDILFFGRISKYKGLEYLLEALKKLKSNSIIFKTVIAGGGNYDFGLDKHYFGSQIDFINRYVPNNEMVSLIEKSRIVVCPYTDATQSGVLMTTIAFNKPIIATSVNGFKDVVVNGINGVLIEPNNSEMLADAIQILLSDKESYDRIVTNLKNNKIGESSWNNIAKSLQTIYINTK
jgi:glycosyltransferase involved in cell wall biosynthesis